MPKNRAQVAELIVCVLVISSCSRQKTISPEELHSHIQEAISLASESELFIDSVRERRTTYHFAVEHAGYLDRMAGRKLKELEQAKSAPEMQSRLQQLRTELNDLEQNLSDLRNGIGNDQALAQSARRIASVKNRLEQGNPRP